LNSTGMAPCHPYFFIVHLPSPNHWLRPIPQFIDGLDTGIIEQFPSILAEVLPNAELLESVAKQWLPALDVSPTSLISTISSIDPGQVIAQVFQNPSTLPALRGTISEFWQDTGNWYSPFTLSPHRCDDPSSYSQIVAFGDSLTDAGNTPSQPGNLYQISLDASGGKLAFPPPSLGYNQGRQTNGLVWVEDLAADRGLALQDFAVIGATSGTTNIAPLSAQDAGINLADFGVDPQQLPGLQQQISKFATQVDQHGADPNALYFLWAGANDYFLGLREFLTGGQDFARLAEVALQAVANVGKAIADLAELGAQKIVVANLPDLGDTPYNASIGAVPAARFFSEVFNTGLDLTLSFLEPYLRWTENPRVDLARVDIYSSFKDILRQPSEYDLTNVTDAWLLSDKSVNPNQYLFYDGNHPTNAGHRLVANAFEDSLGLGQQGDLIKSGSGSYTGWGSMLANSLNDSLDKLLGQLPTSPNPFAPVSSVG
jgi:phospholipase/lecithinase/hemolysin